jgi:hypothetical protein
VFAKQQDSDGGLSAARWRRCQAQAVEADLRLPEPGLVLSLA